MPLLVCATPIGNLDDVTYRVVGALRAADLIVAEDTRRARKLLDRHEIDTDVVSLDRHGEARRVAELLPRLEAGATLALISDAGLPAVSDPGGRLIARAVEVGVPVTVCPGPSAVETALVVSGLAEGAYTFVGFVPRTAAGRERLWRDLQHVPGPVVAFESPRRLPVTLESLAAVDQARPVAVCRELTKVFEEVVRGPAAEVARAFSEPPKGEVTLVIGLGHGPGQTIPAAVLGAASELVDVGVPRRQAASIVARLTGHRANDVYQATLGDRAAG